MTDLSEEKKKQLELAVAAVEKQFGKGTIVTRDKIPDIEFIDSGSPSLNIVLGGGWARGRIVEIYGPESSGKTTLTLHAIANAQAEGGVCAFIDAEHAFDPAYATAVGVDMDKLVFSQPDSGEQALNIVETFASSGAFSLIVVDSIAALVPQKELEGEMGDSNMGKHALLMSQAMRKLTGVSSKNKTTLMFINQIRMKIGLVFGNPETTTGGNALKFYASQRVDVRRKEVLKEGTGDDAAAIGNKTKAKVVKNKVAPPFGEAEFNIIYGQGIDKYPDILAVAVAKGIIEKSGAWYKYNGKPVGQGEPNAVAELKQNSDLYKEVMSKL